MDVVPYRVLYREAKAYPMVTGMNVRLNKKHQRTLGAIFSTQDPRYVANGGALKPFSWHLVLQKTRKEDLP